MEQKKNLASKLSRDERLYLVEHGVREVPVTAQVDILSLNRSGLYSQAQPSSPQEIRLKHRIDELYTKDPFYGSRRITAQLEQEGVVVNRKAVQRHLREMGSEGISPGPNLSKRARSARTFTRTGCVIHPANPPSISGG